MTQPTNFQPEQVALEWSNRVAERMKDIGVPDVEVEETRSIILAFTRTAAQELQRDNRVPLPYTTEVFMVQPQQAHEIIELFLRGVNQVAKKLRDSGKPWEERKVILENMAWKLFNLAKLLVAFLYIPNPGLANLMTTPKDLQLMMKQSADVLLEEELTGKRFGGQFPFLGK